MKNTVEVFDRLQDKIGLETFRELFPVILTDHGCEFADPETFETGLNGEKRTKLFYCEPRHSEQKGELEKTFWGLGVVYSKIHAFLIIIGSEKKKSNRENRIK